MSGPKVSVIVPVYNLEKEITRCVRSILAQTHDNLQIILVDDGSKDNSLSVIRSLAEEDPRIVAIHQENGGVTAARLRGVAEAAGDWIGFVDGDDEIEPWMYEHLLKNAQAYAADISHCGYQQNFPDGKTVYHYNTGMLRQQDNLTGLRDLLEEHQIEPGLCNKLYRRKLFEDLPGQMDRSFKNNEDMLMNYYLFSAAEKSVYEDVCPYHYWYREGSASKRKLNEHQLYDPIFVRKRILESCPEALRETAQDALLRTCLYIFAQLAMEKTTEYKADRKQVRELLMEQKAQFRVLSKRNRILAELICLSPGLFRVAFRCYVTLFLGGEYS